MSPASARTLLLLAGLALASPGCGDGAGGAEALAPIPPPEGQLKEQIPLADGHALSLTLPAERGPDGALLPTAGPWPVILFAHANTYGRCELYEAYPTLHGAWADAGYLVASPDMADLCTSNSRDNLAARRDRLDLALSALRLAALPDSEGALAGRVDLERVLVAGHSRGGSAALLFAYDHPELDGIITMMPVDPDRFLHEEQPISVPALMITGGDDRDLVFPWVEPLEDSFQDSLVWARIRLGVHAWVGDYVPLYEKDDPQLAQAEELAAVVALTTAFLAEVDAPAGAQASSLHSHDAARRISEAAGTPVDLRWRPAPEDRLLIDAFGLEEHGDDGIPLTNALEVYNEALGIGATEVFAYRPEEASPRQFYRKARALQLTGARKPGTWWSEVGEREVDPALTRLQANLRTVDRAVKPELLEVVLDYADADGAVHEVALPVAGLLGPSTLGRHRSQLDLPLSELEPPPARLNRVGLRVQGGTVQVDDLRLVAPGIGRPAEPAGGTDGNEASDAPEARYTTE